MLEKLNQLLFKWQDVLLAKIPLDESKTASGASIFCVGVYLQLWPENVAARSVRSALAVIEGGWITNAMICEVGLAILIIGTYHKLIKSMLGSQGTVTTEKTTISVESKTTETPGPLINGH